jgi:hypothetical protein
MATAIPVLVAFAFIETAKAVTTNFLAPDTPEVPQLDPNAKNPLAGAIASDQDTSGQSRLGSVANAAGVPGGPVRVGQPQVILGPAPTAPVGG